MATYSDDFSRGNPVEHDIYPLAEQPGVPEYEIAGAAVEPGWYHRLPVRHEEQGGDVHEYGQFFLGAAGQLETVDALGHWQVTDGVMQWWINGEEVTEAEFSVRLGVIFVTPQPDTGHHVTFDDFTTPTEDTP